MENKDHANEEFYIGWQPMAPGAQSRFVRNVTLFILICILFIASAFVYFQKGFSTSTFEYGDVTTISGMLTMTPFPMLSVNLGMDMDGQMVVQQVLLVGEGKHGAESYIHKVEKQTGGKLDFSNVTLSGFLIYHDGHTLMEVKELVPSNMDKLSSAIPFTMSGEAYGTISGEIADPKCFFGVMKPGYGKSHLSCAARCIAGGIPPVLKSSTATGEVHYYIIVDRDGHPANTSLLPFVGDRVLLLGKIKSSGDWQFIFVDDPDKIVRVPDVMAYEEITCNHH